MYTYEYTKVRAFALEYQKNMRQTKAQRARMCRKYARMCRNVQECAGAGMCKNVQECAEMCKNVQKMCKNVQKSGATAQLKTSLRKSLRVLL